MQAMDITYRQDFRGQDGTGGRRHPGHRRGHRQPAGGDGRPGGGAGPGAGRWHAGRPVRTRQADVTRQRDVDAALADFDRLDILFNCAGIIKRGQEHDPDVFQQVLDVNLTGTMRRAAARPALKAARGCIVNTASMLTFFGGGLVPATPPASGWGS